MRDARRRRGSASLLAVLVIAVAAAGVVAPASAQDATDLVTVACSMPVSMLERARNGWSADRGPELMWFPAEPDFVGAGLPHVGAWEYIQHVPMLWYGPGHIAARGPVAREVTLADVAPTFSLLTGFPFDAPDGAPMTEAVPAIPGRPRVIVTVVWDAVGRNVLESHPDRWPFLASLIPRGTWYHQAYVGYSPTSTAQAHATIGTGAFPSDHGLVGHRMRIGDTLTTPWDAGPAFWVLPTFSDLYDRAMRNDPVVGIVGTLDIHFGMMSHGAFWHGGDRDVVLTRTRGGSSFVGDEGAVWNLEVEHLPYYELAGYANRVPGFEADKEALDRRDGALDGRWLGNDIESLTRGFHTPARSPYQERVIEELFRRERFGRDRTTDLLFTNFKVTDYASHAWSMNSPEMGDALESQDAALERLVGFLDEEVGRGEWAMVLTADHASMPDPSVTGAFQISTSTAERALNTRFDTDGDGRPVVELVHPTAVYIDEAELAQNGGTLADVARFAMTLTKADVAGPGAAPATGTEGAIAFPWAFPSELLEEIPCL